MSALALTNNDTGWQHNSYCSTTWNKDKDGCPSVTVLSPNVTWEITVNQITEHINNVNPQPKLCLDI